MSNNLVRPDFEYNNAKIFQEAEKISKKVDVSKMVDLIGLAEKWNNTAQKIHEAKLESQMQIYN